MNKIEEIKTISFEYIEPPVDEKGVEDGYACVAIHINDDVFKHYFELRDIEHLTSMVQRKYNVSADFIIRIVADCINSYKLLNEVKDDE